jgi:alpha-mannosidase
MLPGSLSFHGVTFELGPSTTNNALIPAGQRIELPAGRFGHLYLLAAADGDQNAAFGIGGRSVDLTIRNWTGFIGQWDDRIWKSAEEPIAPRAGQQRPNPGTRVNPFAEMIGLRPGFIKRDPVAWFSSHHHSPDGKNQAYSYSYLFCYRIEIPENARTLILPTNSKIRILAISAAQDGSATTPAAPLYDTLERVGR